MRRALGSSKIVIVDAAGADVFTVIGNVNLTAIDDKRGQLVIKWLVKDPTGRNVGDLEQSNPVPARGDQGSWAGLATLSQRRPPRACSNCSKRRLTGPSEPIRKLRRG